MAGPSLPPGGPLELPGRGTTFIRHLDGPPGAPTVFLLHGWTATADLNWFTAYRELGRRFRVVAIDHRGHGRGIRTRRFHLRDCADDVIAACDVLGIDRIVPVGYSMGGPIAQLVWKRHRDRVDGLVLCATSRNFRGRAGERVMFSMLPAVAISARLAPPSARRAMAQRFLSGRLDQSEIGRWAASELERGDGVAVLEAGAALGGFNSAPWIGAVDVPTAVVLTERDNVVPPSRQLRLAASIPGSKVFPVDGDHAVCVSGARRFVPALVAACDHAAQRTRIRS